MNQMAFSELPWGRFFRCFNISSVGCCPFNATAGQSCRIPALPVPTPIAQTTLHLWANSELFNLQNEVTMLMIMYSKCTNKVYASLSWKWSMKVAFMSPDIHVTSVLLVGWISSEHIGYLKYLKYIYKEWWEITNPKS